jgi:type IV pilus assembly protein PilC
MESGVSFADAMSQADLFTGLHARMVSVGFKTGAVDKVMEKLADQYDEEVQTRIGSLVSMIEPTLVSILAVVVGVILLSVMLPLIGIMSAIG